MLGDPDRVISTHEPLNFVFTDSTLEVSYERSMDYRCLPHTKGHRQVR
jgi:hypothetical protein